jgi:ABC-type branched-subunit amino acid transport system permease subunit
MTTVATSRYDRRLYAQGIVKTRVTFLFAAREFVAIETLTDKIEIYSVTATGLEMFVGYIGDRIPATLAMAAVEALCSRPVTQ